MFHLLQTRFGVLLLILTSLMISACGAVSSEKTPKKTSGQPVFERKMVAIPPLIHHLDT